MIYDEEFIIRDLEALYKEKMSAEIACVNTDKGTVSGDTLFLEDIVSEKYIFETLDDRVLNFKGFWIMFGIVETSATEANIDNFIEGTKITFQVATFDNGEENRSNTMYKLLRYRRALKQVIMKNPDVFRGYAKPLVASLKPDAFPYSRNVTILTIGLDITASVTAN